jgi:hypothetical protein
VSFDTACKLAGATLLVRTLSATAVSKGNALQTLSGETHAGTSTRYNVALPIPLDVSGSSILLTAEALTQALICSQLTSLRQWMCCPDGQICPHPSAMWDVLPDSQICQSSLPVNSHLWQWMRCPDRGHILGGGFRRWASVNTVILCLFTGVYSISNLGYVAHKIVLFSHGEHQYSNRFAN